MLIRFNILPQYKNDLCCMIALLIYWIVMYYYYFEMLLPVIHDEPKSKEKDFNNHIYIASIFVASNVICNWFAIMIMDTSVYNIKVRGSGWHYCSDCHRSAPPRAWHCTKCNVCIIKRDHHCKFSGYCIGHNNHRYFLMFIWYSAVAAFVVNIYGNLFLWQLFMQGNDTSANRMLDFYRNQSPHYIWKIFCHWHLLAYGANLFALVFTIGLLYFYLPLAFRGALVYDRSQNTYDEGCLQNIKGIFGVRFYLVWISPLICSALPHDGCEWRSSRRRYN